MLRYLMIMAALLIADSHLIAGNYSGGTSDTVEIRTSAVCRMCKGTIEKAVMTQRGVQSVQLDVPSKVATVVYNPEKTNPEKIRKAIAAVGYTADEVAPEPEAFENLHFCCRPEKGDH